VLHWLRSSTVDSQPLRNLKTGRPVLRVLGEGWAPSYLMPKKDVTPEIN
jgi:hypothetical protein